MDIYGQPEGQACGCLPRETKVGEICPLMAEHIDVIPQEEWPEHIGDVSLKPSVGPIFSQGRVSSCAAEATTQAVVTSRAWAGLPEILLNPWTLYCFVTTRDNGSSLDANLKRARDVGILPDRVWPRSEHAWNDRPPVDLFEEHAVKIDEFYDLNSIDEFGTAQLVAHAIVYARKVHALMACELRNRRRFAFANSWGANWGDNGFGEESLSVIEWRYGAFAVRTTA